MHGPASIGGGDGKYGKYGDGGDANSGAVGGAAGGAVGDSGADGDSGGGDAGGERMSIGEGGLGKAPPGGGGGLHPGKKITGATPLQEELAVQVSSHWSPK